MSHEKIIELKAQAFDSIKKIEEIYKLIENEQKALQALNHRIKVLSDPKAAAADKALGNSNE